MKKSHNHIPTARIARMQAGITSTADLKFLHWVAAGSSRNFNSKKQHQKSHPESLPPRRGHRVKAGSQLADYGRARDAKLAAPGTKTDVQNVELIQR
jgi:hypothetical protein